MALRDSDPHVPGFRLAEGSYGRSASGPTTFLHRVDFALEADGLPIGARWVCGGSSSRAALYERIEGEPLCVRCFPPSDRKQVVYFIERDDLIKIGWTSNLAKRSAAVGGKVLVAQPGDRLVERTLHRVFRNDHDHGEWFKKSPGLMSYIDSLMEKDL